MSQNVASTEPRVNGGNIVGIRFQPEVFEQLKAAARRRNQTVTEYCRRLILERLGMLNEEGAADVYKVALRTLEDVQELRDTTLMALLQLFPEQAQKVDPSSQGEAAGRPLQTRGHKVIASIERAQAQKAAKARQRLLA